MSAQFRYLFSPLKIGRVAVPNRISFSAHLTGFARESLPSDRHAAYYAARARGGTGLIITEEQSVHPTDRAYEKLIEAFRPEVLPGYKKITRAVHEYETRIFAQLNHNGQQCSGALSRLPVWAPSAVPDPLYRETPKVMEVEDIREVIDYFCRSAVHAREGGFDGIELQFGHSSLARQFMSPLTNLRSDEYGGSFENRLRFPLELLTAVRKTVGEDFTLGVRLCADEMTPWGGITLKDARMIASALESRAPSILWTSPSRPFTIYTWWAAACICPSAMRSPWRPASRKQCAFPSSRRAASTTPCSPSGSWPTGRRI